MRALLIISILCLYSGVTSHAQELSEKHRRKLERISNEAKRAERYKKYLKKDSVRYHKQLADSLKQKARQALKDSLSRYAPDVAPDSTFVDQQTKRAQNAVKDSLDNYLPGIALDSTTADQLKTKARSKAKSTITEISGVEVSNVTIDSTTTHQLKEKVKERGTSALEDASGMELSDITVDSTTTEKIKKETVKRAEKMLKETDEHKAISNLPEDSELKQLEAYKTKLKRTEEEIRRAAATRELKQKMTTRAKEYITENIDKIQQVQQQMSKLKQKYSYVPNSNDLSSAVKRSSLKGESLWKRLVIGGNFNISKTNPLKIDLSPVIGYRFNKLFEAGVTGIFRTQFKADKNGFHTGGDQEVYGYSIFASHMAFRNFFGYVEGESMSIPHLEDDEINRVWEQTLLIGIGRKINVSKWLEMQALVLFNVLHDNRDGVYNSPVVFKTGFRARK